jgi:hypothetical protein
MQESMDHRGSPGPTVQRWEPPDICITVLIGDISGHEMRRLMAETMVLIAGKPYVLGLIDMSRLGVLSPEARQVARTEALNLPMRGTAVFGASFHHRVLAILINKAASLLKKDHQPVAFFVTEAEAREWLEARRKVIAAIP